MANKPPIRIGGSKVRSGCTTCKIRHIKCDEARPSCNKCVQSGFKCAYETAKETRPAIQWKYVHYGSVIPSSPATQPSNQSREQRALQYFCERTASQLAGPFSDEFWSQKFMILAEHQSSARHALIALGSAHEDFTNNQGRNSEFMLHHYSKSIAEMVDLWSSNTAKAIETALGTCILYTCIESLRGCYASAMNTILSGIKLLDQQVANKARDPPTILPSLQVCWFFARMTSQIMDVGGSRFDEHVFQYNPTRHDIPKTFSNPDQAMMSLEMLWNQISHLHKEADRVAAEPVIYRPLLPKFAAKLYDIQLQHQAWQQALRRMVAKDNTYGTVESRHPALIAIEMQNKVISVMLVVDIFDPECDFDCHEATFADIVEDAEEFLSHIPGQGTRIQAAKAVYSQPQIDRPVFANQSRIRLPIRTAVDAQRPIIAPKPDVSVTPYFSLSSGCVGPLYFVAARCRNTKIRHHALAVLQRCNRREGLWDSSMAALVADKVIKMEEATARIASIKNKDTTTRDVSQRKENPIPCQARVKIVNTHWNEENGGQAEFTTQYAGSENLGQPYGGLEYHSVVQW